MNRKQVIAAAALVLTGTAVFAQTEVELQNFGAAQPSVTTRAAVKNEVLRAHAAGQALAPAEVDVAGLFPKAQASGATRAAVRAEVLKARADGTLARQAELDTNVGATVASVRSREEVRAEAIAAMRAARVQAGH